MIAIINECFAAYEQDIRELLMAFFPGEPFCFSEHEEAGLLLLARDFSFVLKEKRSNTEKTEEAEIPEKSEETDKSEETEKTEGTETEKAKAEEETEKPEKTEDWEAVSPVSDRILLSESRKENKTRIKTALYTLLSAYTKRSLPWGTLTGIRPVKLFEALLQEGLSDEAVKAQMQKTYGVSEEKAALSLEIAKREREVLSRIPYKEGWSLYIGIPFCPTTCMYCSFTSYPIKRWEERTKEYLSCLRKELRQLRALQTGEGGRTKNAIYQKPLQTIYIGGGTPTSLSEERLSELLSMVEEELSLSSVSEYTVEAGRPDSITREKLQVLKRHGIGRISINPQTMNQKTLDLIGRRHTVEAVKTAFRMAREEGFQNINMDIIMGLPEETVSDVRHTLSEIEAMRPDSLTVHTLSVKRAARLNTEGNAWSKLPRAGADEAMEMTRLGKEAAEGMGLKPYYLYRQKNMAGNQENVGYAEAGKENLYNILMMEEQHTVIGVGAGSSTKLVLREKKEEKGGRKDGEKSSKKEREKSSERDREKDGEQGYRVERFENIKNVAEYLPRIDELLLKRAAFFEA